MTARVLADIVLLLHLAFIVFVVLGALLVFRWRRIAWLHIPMVLWASMVNLTPWLCPLTPLEKYFRAAAGQAGYEGGFIAHYLLPVIYPRGLTYDLALIVGIGIVVWNVLLYSLLVYRIRHAS